MGLEGGALVCIANLLCGSGLWDVEELVWELLVFVDEMKL